MQTCSGNAQVGESDSVLQVSERYQDLNNSDNDAIDKPKPNHYGNTSLMQAVHDPLWL